LVVSMAVGQICSFDKFKIQLKIYRFINIFFLLLKKKAHQMVSLSSTLNDKLK